MPFIRYEPLPEPERHEWFYNETCRHPEHNPPNMIVLKPGIHTYQCPACGHTQSITVQNPSMTLHDKG